MVRFLVTERERFSRKTAAQCLAEQCRAAAAKRAAQAREMTRALEPICRQAADEAWAKNKHRIIVAPGAFRKKVG
jgi:hypothetical protein